MSKLIVTLALCGAAAGGAVGGFTVSEHKAQHLRDCLAWGVIEPYCSSFTPPGKLSTQDDTRQIPGAPPGWHDATPAEVEEALRASKAAANR